MLALFLPTLGLELAPPSSVVVVGGSSGMGKALATSVVQRGGRVLLASRSASKLKAAATKILTETGCVDVTAVATYVVDASDESQVAALADSLPLHEWEGVTTSDDTGEVIKINGVEVAVSDSKIRSATGRKSAVPQCFQPARFSFLNWLEFCL